MAYDRSANPSRPGNAPRFDPLHPTDEEERDMVAGYLAGGKDDPMPALASVAFEHGWRMRRNDRARVVDDDQKALVKRWREEMAR